MPAINTAEIPLNCLDLACRPDIFIREATWGSLKSDPPDAKIGQVASHMNIRIFMDLKTAPFLEKSAHAPIIRVVDLSHDSFHDTQNLLPRGNHHAEET